MYRALISVAGILTFATLPTVSSFSSQISGRDAYFYVLQVDAEIMTQARKAYMEKVVSEIGLLKKVTRSFDSQT